MTTNITLYKVLNLDGTPYHGGKGKWKLPKNGKPGAWMPAIKGDLEVCKNGYHACREQDLVRWLGPAIYELEYDGELVEAEDKVVIRRARLVRCLDTWNERTARLFAADCADRVLHMFEAWNPGDARPRTAIETARRYAVGTATRQELSAAHAAAYAAYAATADYVASAAHAYAASAATNAAYVASSTAHANTAHAAAHAADAANAAHANTAHAAAHAADAANADYAYERLFQYLRGEVGQ